MKKISCSCTQDKGNLNHNFLLSYRKNLKNVNHELTKENVIFKSITKTQIEREFNSIFEDDVLEYNYNQPREDRKIKNYYQNCLKNQKIKEPWREIIYQIGNKEDAKDPELRQKMKNCLTKFYEEFEKTYPNLKVIGAVIHMDEPNGTPHLHLDYVPVAERSPNGKGLQHKVNLEEAIKQMGFDKEYSLINKKEKAKPLYFNGFRNHSMQLLEDIMAEEGLERKIIGDTSEHLTVTEFKEEQDAIKKYINENRDEVAKKATEKVVQEREDFKEIKKMSIQQVDDYYAIEQMVNSKKQELENLEPQWQEQKQKELEAEKRRLQKEVERQEAVRQQEHLQKQKEMQIVIDHAKPTGEVTAQELENVRASLDMNRTIAQEAIEDKKTIKDQAQEIKHLRMENNIFCKIINWLTPKLPPILQDKIDNWIGASTQPTPTEEEITKAVDNYIEDEGEEVQ